MERLEKLMEAIDKFSKDRDWDQFHTPVNLVKSISIEANELLECFQWSDTDFDEEHVKEELADVMNYCLQLCLALELDPVEIIEKKMIKNAEKYPIDQCKGSSEKYTELRRAYGKVKD